MSDVKNKMAAEVKNLLNFKLENKFNLTVGFILKMNCIFLTV